MWTFEVFRPALDVTPDDSGDCFVSIDDSKKDSAAEQETAQYSHTGAYVVEAAAVKEMCVWDDVVQTVPAQFPENERVSAAFKGANEADAAEARMIVQQSDFRFGQVRTGA